MSHPDIHTLIPSLATALALAGCASPAPPTRALELTPIVIDIDPNPTNRNFLVQFPGTLLSKPMSPGGNTVVMPATLTCALTEKGNGPGRPPLKVFETCNVAKHDPPLVPADRREWCDQYSFVPNRGGQINLKTLKGEIYIFTTPNDLGQTLGPYSRCAEYIDSNAHAPNRSIYERPARGRVSRREAKMRQLEAMNII